MASLVDAYLAADRKRRRAGSAVPVKRQLGTAEPFDPDAPPPGPPPAYEPDFTSPAELSERYANTEGTEPEPLFIRKPYSAGFLAGLAGGEQGIRTLLAAKEQYLRHKEEQGRQKLEAERYQDERRDQRNLTAERLQAPELAGDLGVTEALQRLRDRKIPRKLLEVSPGASLVDPESGEVIRTVPDRARESKDEEELGKEMRARKEAIRKEVGRIDQDISQVKRDIAEAEAEDRMEEVAVMEEQLAKLEGARRNVVGQPGGYAAIMGGRVMPPTRGMPARVVPDSQAGEDYVSAPQAEGAAPDLEDLPPGLLTDKEVEDLKKLSPEERDYVLRELLANR